MDLNLSFAHPVYLDTLLDYQKVLEQRNKFLKDYREKKESNWEGQSGFKVQLVQLGTEIIKRRKNFLEQIFPQAQKYYQEISAGMVNNSQHISIIDHMLTKEKLKLEYKPTFFARRPEEMVNNSQPISIIDHMLTIEQNYLLAFEEAENREKSWGVTLIGPHRDDIELKINSYDLREFGSQGQARTAMLALKLAAMDYLATLREQTPILLLDEVFADLDEKRTEYLSNLLEKKGQVFIATSKEKELGGKVLEGKKFHIKENQVLES
ncbi:MAG: DNA replication and repair protein RecF [candidate division Zixibacteria bacterium RBG-1]|nr:MAG: DNA replication and repair protein RecF [candidate division Zixibacteria bacterium RBG-1]OGC85019.1 MAG: hypothetical protein A2V73_03140 [candidate division Zixibacteria bacterium RBG_19FT_COMBO_42_43]